MKTQQLTKHLTHIERQLRDLQSEVAQTRYQLRQPVDEYDARARWIAIGGLWKGRVKEDSVKWQRRIRAEWDR